MCMLPIISADLFPTPSQDVMVGFGDGTGQTGVSVFIPEEIFNSSEATSNSTENWITDIGSLSTVNATQFSNQGGVLNLIESWVSSRWCDLTGCTMTGSITAPWFLGKFNWTIEALSTSWLSFDGSELSFNETNFFKQGNETYLRLDAENSPITGDLEIQADLNVTQNITVGDSYKFNGEQPYIKISDPGVIQIWA